jgi:CO/xanthine dehydrogenase FAD-binding subunit
VRGIVSEVEIHSPKNLKEALVFLAQNNSHGHNWKIIAGATDLAVEFNAGHLKHKLLLNIWALRKELSGIKKAKEGLSIGAMTSFTQVHNNDFIKKYFPSLAQAANLVGGVQIQNRATIAGNIANASPAGDSLPALCAYEAILTLKNKAGERKVPITEFYKGYKQLDLAGHEIITEIFLPTPAKKATHYYRKVGTRQAQAISKVVACGLADVTKGRIGKISFSLGSVGPYTLRCKNVEKFLTGGKLLNSAGHEETVTRAQAELLKDITPRDDIRSTKSYREFVSKQLLGEFLRCL